MAAGEVAAVMLSSKCRQAVRVAMVATVITIPVIVSTAAFADLYAGGNLYCNYKQVGVSHSYSTGQTDVYTSDVYKTFYNGSTWEHHYVYNDKNGETYWGVDAVNGKIDNSGTYGSCVDTGV
ncbi:MAG TPA: hypothetical protein VFI30_07985 [Nocardioidaceae bacterium]|nr:hypothetical protein [Nocardioidaceae bacterium]